ncbi:MAG: hypothetical protein ABJL67_11585 [Sulfitobacter sp.]
MPIFGRGSGPVTTPHLRRKLSDNPLKVLVKIAAIPIMPLLFLWMFGGPALLTTYDYRGRESAPNMIKCDYLTLQGWRVVRPSSGVNQCAGITLLPFDMQTFLEMFYD